MSIVWSNPEPDTSRDGQTHPARTLVSALLGLPSQTQIAQELKSPHILRVSIWVIALRIPTPLRYAAELVTAIYNALVSSMTRTYASSRRLCSVLLFLFFLAPLLALAADWTEPERQLAAKIAGTTGPGTISLEVINRASFTKTDVETIRRGLTTQLSSQGVQVVKPDQAVAAVQVSLTQNLQDYVWVAEIRQGNSPPTIQMMTVNRPGAAVTALPGASPHHFADAALVTGTSHPRRSRCRSHGHTCVPSGTRR